MRSRTISPFIIIGALILAGVVTVELPARILTGLPTKTYQFKPPLRSTINWGDPITKGLVGVWNFNEGGGTVVNDAAYYGKGSFVNSPTWANGGPDGAVLNFASASSQYIDITNNNGPSYLLLGFTGVVTTPAIWSTWELKFKYNSNRNYNGLISKTTSGGVPCPVDSYVDSGGSLNFFYGSCGTFASAHISATVSPNTWYHMFLVNGDPVQAKLILYLNGSIAASTTWNDGLLLYDQGTNNIRIGSRNDLVTLLDGTVSYARVWNRSLQYNEVQRLTNDPFCFMSYPIQNTFLPSASGSRTMPPAVF